MAGIGVAKVIVGESSHVSTQQVLPQTGMLDIARKTGAEVVIFDEGEWVPTEELNTVIHSDLVIMDTRKCFISGGPSEGEMREPGLSWPRATG